TGIVGARESGEHDLIALDSGQYARVGAQQPDGASHDRVEYRLHIRLRATDDAQDVARGGLRVQRRRQLPGTGLELLEQPHVLDGDDGLVGKGFEQADLFLGKWAHLESPDDDRSDGRLLA